MAEFPALPLWTDAYLADTRHLSTEEHGAYLLLLMEAWRRPTCALPDDDALLARLAGLPLERWTDIRATVMAFWSHDGRRREWRQKRLVSERAWVASKSVSQRDKALRRWKGTKKTDAVAMPEGMPERCPDDAPTPTPTPIEDIAPLERPERGVQRGENAVAARGSRLPLDWRPSNEDTAYAADLGLDPQRIAADFTDYWHAKPGAAARKTSWPLTWRTWCRREADRRPAARANGGHQDTFDDKLRAIAEGAGLVEPAAHQPGPAARRRP